MTVTLRLPALALLALLAATSLTGCGPQTDIPGNAPRLGRWERESKLVALIANDVWIDRDKAPFNLPPDSREEKPCFEPMLKTQNEINRDLLANSDSICRLDTLDTQGGLITATGKCGPVDKGGDTITGTIEFTGQERDDRAEATVSVQMLVRGRSGATERVRAAYQTTWRRLGDCGR